MGYLSVGDGPRLSCHVTQDEMTVPAAAILPSSSAFAMPGGLLDALKERNIFKEKQ